MAATSGCQGAPGQLFMLSFLKTIFANPKHLLWRVTRSTAAKVRPPGGSRANRQNQRKKFVADYITRSRIDYKRAVNTNRCILGRCSVEKWWIIVENQGKVREDKAR